MLTLALLLHLEHGSMIGASDSRAQEVRLPPTMLWGEGRLSAHRMSAVRSRFRAVSLRRAALSTSQIPSPSNDGTVDGRSQSDCPAR